MWWLSLLFALEIGFSPMGGWNFYEEGSYAYVNNFNDNAYTKLEGDLRVFNFISFKSTVTTWVGRDGPAAYSPFWVTYDTTLRLDFDFIEIGWFHTCTHPLQPYVSMTGYSNPVLEGGYSQVYLRIESGHSPNLRERLDL